MPSLFSGEKRKTYFSKSFCFGSSNVDFCWLHVTSTHPSPLLFSFLTSTCTFLHFISFFFHLLVHVGCFVSMRCCCVFPLLHSPPTHKTTYVRLFAQQAFLIKANLKKRGGTKTNYSIFKRRGRSFILFFKASFSQLLFYHNSLETSYRPQIIHTLCAYFKRRPFF